MEVIVILTAITKNGRLIIPANFSNEQLKDIKKRTTFQCMQCKQKVILKNGTINVPHFAHKQKSDCSQSFSEGETEDHLNGKLQLYNFFQHKQIQAQLEAYIPSIKQRPDILIQTDQNYFAIEYQCSKLTATIMTERSNGYLQKSIIPYWILKTPPISDFPNQQIGKMQLSTFIQQFFTIHPTFGKTIITYCPKSKHFHYISNVLHLQANNYIIKTNKLSLDHQTWPFAQVKRITLEQFKKYLNIYTRHRFKHLENIYNYNKNGIQTPLLQVCYRWRMTIQDIPLFIGIPTSYAEVFHMHAVEWQIQLIDYLNASNISIDQVTDAHCNAFLQFRPIGQASNEQKVKAVKAYIKVLQKSMIKVESTVYLSEMNMRKMICLLYNEFLAN